MFTFFKSLFGKIAIIYLFVLLGLGVVLAILSVRTYADFYREADQKLNRDLAEHLKEDFVPFLSAPTDEDGIKTTMHNLMVYNPRIEIYVLDRAGEILLFFAPKEKVKRERVSTEPILAFLSESSDFPLLGDDPRDPAGQKPFSVATLDMNGEPGYLYVILGGELFDSNLSMARDSRIASVALLGLALVLFGAAFVGLLLFAYTTQRFTALTRVVKDFEAGNFSRRAQTNNSDEIGQLGSTFNQMADSIVTNMDALKHTDNLRRELIANVSHDLRSPLASIQGYIESIIIRDERMGPDERKEALEIVLKNSQMLNGLVAELFELSKLDAEQVKPDLEPFSMAELLQDVVMKFKPSAEKAGVNLESSFPKNAPLVSGDIGMIERVLSNLIRNAIHFTPEEGVVNVGLVPLDAGLRVFVSDTGQGIPEEEIPLVTERFYRIEKSRSRLSGGGGLGLAISKKLLALHDSSILISSELGVGTTVYFDLKKAV